MPTTGDRRRDALSKDRIVAAAIEILDADGEGGLTFRALTGRLGTGAGAVYWHVANKQELLTAAAGAVLARALADPARGRDDAEDGIRAAALGVYDALVAHPWVGAQLAREPWQGPASQILEALGRPLAGLGVPAGARFGAATTLLYYVLGLAAQRAAAVRLVPPGTDRTEFLAAVAERWAGCDRTEYPFLRSLAPEVAGHDDRVQFLAGIDLILAGIATGTPLRRP